MQKRTGNTFIIAGLILAAFGLFSARSMDLSTGNATVAQAVAYDSPVVTPLVSPSPAIEFTPSAPSSTPFQPATETQEIEATPEPTATPVPSPTALPIPKEAPLRLEIPVIALDAPVEEVHTVEAVVDGENVVQWQVPNRFASGWHTGTARLGEPGNTVLNGHHNVYQEVFGELKQVNLGDEIWVSGETYRYRYVVVNKMVLPEKYQDLDIRMENAAWIMPSEDERLTLITCWPRESNTHRLILVARPTGAEPLDPS